MSDGKSEIMEANETEETAVAAEESAAETDVAPADTDADGEAAADVEDAPEAADTGPEASDEAAPEEVEEEAPIDGAIEAVLFSSEIPTPVRRLADLTRSNKRSVLEAIDRLNVHYGETARAFRISEIAGGYQMVTTSEHGDILGKLHKQSVPTRLSRAALETLSIIAFKQPVTRAEIDRIRGVSASDRVLRHLIERRVVKIAGRAEAPGRPLLYGTTKEFLGYFGLGSLDEMPRTEELQALLAGQTMPGHVLDEDTGELVPAPATVTLTAEPSLDDGGGELAGGGGSAGEGESSPEGTPMGYADEDEVLPPEAPDAEDLSHSGEESDDREGVPAT